MNISGFSTSLHNEPNNISDHHNLVLFSKQFFISFLSYFLAKIFLSNFATNAKRVFNYFLRVWLCHYNYVFAFFIQLNIYKIFFLMIKFTHATEKNNSLIFLDLLVIYMLPVGAPYGTLESTAKSCSLCDKNSTGGLKFYIHQKPTSNDQVIPR